MNWGREVGRKWSRLEMRERGGVVKEGKTFHNCFMRLTSVSRFLTVSFAKRRQTPGEQFILVMDLSRPSHMRRAICGSSKWPV